jgi:uncharacterized protein YuzE
MQGIKFELSVSVDENSGAVRMAYLRVRDGQSAETKEFADGLALADYDEMGQLIGVEFLAPCGVQILETIANQEPEPVRRFLYEAAPRSLVVAA